MKTETIYKAFNKHLEKEYEAVSLILNTGICDCGSWDKNLQENLWLDREEITEVERVIFFLNLV